jgi:hypothetical protein
MRSLLAFAALALTSCGVPAVVQLQGDGTEQPEQAIPDSWYLDRNVVGDCTGGFADFAIPCDEVLNVCIDHGDGNYSMLWMPEVYPCGPESATMADICAVVADDRLPFYGVTRETCPT